VFALALGLTWKLGANTRTEQKLADWLGARGQAGRMPPNGFPKSGRFGD
jgi:topoisomerase-4 subunit A